MERTFSRHPRRTVLAMFLSLRLYHFSWTQHRPCFLSRRRSIITSQTTLHRPLACCTRTVPSQVSTFRRLKSIFSKERILRWISPPIFKLDHNKRLGQFPALLPWLTALIS